MTPTSLFGAGGDPAAAVRENACSTVASTLWRERELLEKLLFCLTSQQLVLSAGAVRWLTAADAQVREAVDALTGCELHRAIETDELARLLGLPGDASLDDIVTHADEPWNSLLADHRDALRDLVSEITAVTAENRRLLRAGADVVRETLERVGAVTPTYGPRGTTTAGSISLLLDRQA
ncbi:FlgN protein [Jatrophihabitans endophyticus]|uniref:FlgN protein n=1 Tax=Jatrophihabitans endophyticus TaxID=1206085 RepID=A0A1M5IE60_9ACTN|nr:flagellar protein FlgN [Jatrophihabitans endophyticus]SHG26572.1 FlgN protein [Jatrophihabitans endophyticus]